MESNGVDHILGRASYIKLVNTPMWREAGSILEVVAVV
jgi:hypothetical protein